MYNDIGGVAKAILESKDPEVEGWINCNYSYFEEMIQALSEKLRFPEEAVRDFLITVGINDRSFKTIMKQRGK